MDKSGQTLLAFIAGMCLCGLSDRLGVSNAKLALVGGAFCAAAFALIVLDACVLRRASSDGTEPIFVSLFCMIGATCLGVAAARCVTDRFGTKVSHCDRPCQCRENNPETAGRGPGGAGGEASGASGAFFDFEGFAPGVGGPGRRNEEVFAKGGAVLAVGETGFDQFAGGGNDGAVVEVGRGSAAGAVAQNGKFRVVHAAESSTGTDKLSAAAKGAE